MSNKRTIIAAARIVGAWLLVIVALPVGWFVYQNYLWQRLPNDTIRYLYQYRTMEGRNADVSLVPGLFKGGEAKPQVEAHLLGAGLGAWSTSYATVPAGAESIQVFHLNTGMLNMVCGSELFVIIGYDQSDLLATATVQQGGACL